MILDHDHNVFPDRRSLTCLLRLNVDHHVRSEIS